MQFISLEFLIFLPIFFAVYWWLKGNFHRQNLAVVAGSYIFYGWADWRYMFLLAGYTLVSFFSGLMLEKTESRRGRKLILWSVVAINIGVLGLYKYFDFFVANLSRVLSAMGFEPDMVTLELVLPIGISFFTFQALSYTIDVYRKKIRPTHDAVSFFAFLSFFPQMIAGPIERADQLLPQFERPRVFDYNSALYGMKRILWGMVKKMLIADNCAVIVDSIFPFFTEHSCLDLWLGALCFTMQIYGDFSGYSDIAVGCGRLLGIKLNENFRMPYFSHSFKEFWRRWHITLNTWLIDYVYIPLGGNRKGLKLTILNIFVVFTLSGLWHGAELSYVAWGIYHGALLVIALLISIIAARITLNGYNIANRFSRKLLNGIAIFCTFLPVLIGLVMFRSHSVMKGLEYIAGMFSFSSPKYPPNLDQTITLILIAAFLITEWFSRNRVCPICFQPRGLFRFTAVRWAFFYLLTIITLLFRGSTAPFIYFQF